MPGNTEGPSKTGKRARKGDLVRDKGTVLHPPSSSPQQDPKSRRVTEKHSLVSVPTCHFFPMSLDEEVQILSALLKLPLTGKQQLMLLILAKTRLMHHKSTES